MIVIRRPSLSRCSHRSGNEVEVDWYDVDPTSQARVRAPMPPILGGVTYQRLCSDFAKRDNRVSIVAVGSGLRGQVGVEGGDIGTR